MKKKRYILLVIIGFGLLFLLGNQLVSTNKDGLKISYQDTFHQEEESYLVYFWQQSCHYCQEIEPEINDYLKQQQTPIYVVDMKKTDNLPAWYNWQSHHKNYDLVIGHEENGADIIDHKVELDPKVDWTFHKNKAGEIVAVHNTPLANVYPDNASELEITGTPTMLRITNGKLSDYAVGVDSVRQLLTSP